VSTKYLFPCRCGRQITVEPREAGETTVCPCGQSLLIPTMLEMAGLEPAPVEAPAPSAERWGWQHRLLLVGGTLLAAAIIAGVCLHWSRPKAPADAIDAEAIRQTANNLSPIETWHNWELMKQGLDRRTDQKFAEKMTLYHIGQACAGVLALLCIVLLGTGMAMKKRGGDKEKGRRKDGAMA